MIGYAGTNGTSHSMSRKILNRLPNFKMLILEKLPDCEIYILRPTLQPDNGDGTLTVNQLINHLLQLNIDIVDNRNIISKHLSQSVLRHLVINFLESIKKV